MPGDNTVQIFISYARDDNVPPPNAADGAGFVSYLQDYLNYKFRTAGPVRPNVWRDQENIHRGERFPDRLREELERSSILLVVLSQNWMASEYCLSELNYFKECRRRRNEPIDERIIVLEKNQVDQAERPSGLENQEGYKFYELTGRQTQPVIEFFVRGKPLENKYWPVFDELFELLLRRSKQLVRGTFPPPPPAPIGRTVYVAKPASDMFDEYIRVVAELTNKGYNVVPNRTVDLPSDGSAPSFIDNELGGAEASVHLVGESADGIVKLQLARAAAKIESTTATGGAGSPFRRIIWAPKIFRRDGRSDGEALTRDPHEALGRVGAEYPTDKVFGEDPGNFRLAMVQCLDQWKPKSAPLADDVDNVAAVELNSKVFVLHHEKDAALARGLKRALRQHNVEAVLPARDDDEVQRKNFDKAMMKACDAIVICWGMTSETWTRAQASQLEDWRSFGRSHNWEPRSVVLGPPPGEFKAEFKEDGPPGEIDEIVVVDDPHAIPSDEVRKLIPRRPPVQS